MQMKFTAFFALIVLCWGDAGLGKLELRPSFSYLTFTSSLATNPSGVVIDSTKMYILAKNIPESNKYVFLERELDRAKNEEGISYQKRNYNPKTPLLLNGFTPQGYTVVDGELKHVVATDPQTDELYVLTLVVKSTTSTPSNVDYQYYVEEKKRVPKDSRLLSGLIVKSTEAARTPSSLTSGRRIFMCGTTESNGLFFAVHNTVYNLTEYVHQDPRAAPVLSESCKDLHVNTDTGHLVIVSSRTFTDGTAEGVFVRGFSLERMAMDWEVEMTGFYSASCLVADFVLVARCENSGASCSTKFKSIWIETGEEKENIDLTGQITANAKVLSMVSDTGDGIYALLRKPDTTSVTGSDTVYGMALLEFQEPDSKLSFLATRWFSSASFLNDETKESFGFHPGLQLFLYYPPRDTETAFPAVILAGHINVTESTGLLLYEFTSDSGTNFGYNPFAVSGGTDCVHQVNTASAKCLSCSSNLYLRGFTCKAENEIAYAVDGKRGGRCHFTCADAKCTGPKKNQCTECRGSLPSSTYPNFAYNSLLGQCFCTIQHLFSVNDGKCNKGDKGDNYFQLSAKRKKAPSYVFELKNNFPESFFGFETVSTDESTFKLSHIQLPIASKFDSIPDDFTIGFWFHELSAVSSNKILSAFGNIAITYRPGGASGKVLFEISNNNGDIKHTLDTTDACWKFISLSVQNTPLGYTLTLYVYYYGSNESNSLTKTGYPPISYKPYDNVFVLSDNSASVVGNLVYLSRYYTKEDMDIARSIRYHTGLQVTKDIISYWKLSKKENDLFTDEFDDTLKSTNSPGNIVEINAPETAGSYSNLKTAAECGSKWGVVGTMFDLFGYSKFPAFSFDTLNFGANELEPKINLNTFALLSGIVRNGDYISYHFNGCSGTPLGQAKVTLTAADKVKVEQNVKFATAESVRGRFVDSCYCSDSSGCVHLGRTYFPLLPVQIYPAHGKTSTEASTPIQFLLTGGDQSYGDKLTLINMGKDVLTTTKETIIVDEKDSGYSSYSGVRRASGDYDSISTPSLDRGVYTVGWRPSYMSYLVDERNVIYKNLYNTWTLQGPPHVKFPPLDGVPGVFKYTVVHKGEFYYIDLVGDGQADGDQILFCNTGCNYPNRNSRPFQRENGRYPPIWIGEKENGFGIFNIESSNKLAEKLFICWRSAARATLVAPEDDQWTTLNNLQDPSKRAYILINDVTSTKPEIEALSLYIGNADLDKVNDPVVTPVLYQGDTVWFRFADRTLCPRLVSGGRVEISRVIYDDYYRTSYTLEPAWEQECEGPLGGGECITSRMKLDTSTCQYTLQEIPHSTMKPGHDYMLVIYSGSFISTTGTYLGNDDGGTQQFKFLFKYQEATFTESAADKFVPSDTKITIKGTNLGNLYIPGSAFVESRKLFGVAVEVTADPACGNSAIRASYIPEHLEQNPAEIVLQGIDLTACQKSNDLSVNLKLLKIADDFGDYPLWSHTNTSQSVRVGKVACDPSCKTCSGPTSFDCLTCDIDSSFPYLYKSRCLSKCENDLPYSNIIFDSSGYNIAYYECTDVCRDGTYLDEELSLCFDCNSQCGTCTAGGPSSCTTCGSTYVNSDAGLNYMNVYKEMYWFKNMCFTECPQIERTEGDASSNVILTKEFEHSCVEDTAKLDNPRGIQVTVQRIIFPQKVNIKRSIKLRALLTDLREHDENTSVLKAAYIWSSHPTENKGDGEFETSDKRVFQNYTEANLHRAITTLNMNAFNYKSESDPMRLIVRSWANGYFDYDMVEFYGNRPPELDDNNVKVKHSDSALGTGDLSSKDALTTQIKLNVRIGKTQDADDLYPKLSFKVLLVPRSLVLPEIPSTVTIPESALSLLAQLPEQYMVIYSNKVLATEDGAVELEDIFIPPLINGPQAISKSEGVYSNKVSCDLFVYAEDRYLGVSKIKFIFNFEESHDPANVDEMLLQFTKYIKEKEEKRELTWNDALRVAHTLRAINPEHTVYYMAYNHCSRDDQCNNDGKCVTSGGWSKCVCTGEFTGITCSWRKKQMNIEEGLIGMVVSFLNSTLLLATKSHAEHEVTSTSDVDQLANVLIGVLANPEPVRGEYFSCIVSLAEYMTRMNYITGGRLEDFEKTNVFRALDAVIKYVYYHIRQDIYEFYLLGELSETLSEQQIAQFNEMREGFSTEVLKVRDALYRFANAVSLVQYPLSSPYSVEYDTFEIFLSAELEQPLFEKLGDALAIQMKSGGDFIRVPSSILDKMRKEVTINEEFKIRIIKWKESPYLFSEHHSEVCTPLFNFALMNSNSTLLDMDLDEPIVFFAPMSKAMKNLPTQAVRCMYFDNANQILSKVRSVTKINVNQLDLTDEEKMALYPEWNAEYYHSKNLIVEEEKFLTATIGYPEFKNAKGLSSYGNILSPTEYPDTISCAMYTANEVVGVAERKRSHTRGFPPIDMIHDYDPMDSIYFNIGMYTCIVVGSLLVVSFIGSLALDSAFLPKHAALIESHRNFGGKETTNELDGTSDPMLTMGSGGQNDSDDRGGVVKIGVDVDGSSNGKIRKHGKPKIKRRRGDAKRTSVDGTSQGTNGRTTMTEDKLLTSQVTNQGISISHTKTDLKIDGETITTTHGHGSTHDQQITGEWSTSDPQTTNPEDQRLKSSFVKTKPTVSAKRMREEMDDIENIFSNDYVQKAEAKTFKFGKIFFSSNLLLNLLFRDNNIYTRPARCFVMYSYVYIMLFWCAVLTSIVAKSLTNPETGKPISFLASKHVWIIFVSPILSSILLYLVAGVFKVDEKRIHDGKTVKRYNEIMKEYRQKIWMRRVFGTILILICLAGINIYVCRFSTKFGWKTSYQWLWLSILSFPVDILIYDVAIAMIQAVLYTCNKDWGRKIFNLRRLKQAEYQE